MIAYRFLTGTDDAAFCHRVTGELQKGWQLYGMPTLSFDAAKGIPICGQAITKQLGEFEYSSDTDLSAL